MLGAEYKIALHPREWSVDGLGKAVAEVTGVPVCDQQLVPDTDWKPIELSSGKMEKEMMSQHPLDYYNIKKGSSSNVVSVPILRRLTNSSADKLAGVRS